MARPSRCRRVCSEPDYDSFSPDGILSEADVIITVDEYEAIRLIDYEKKTQEECANAMQISRTTVTAIYDRARYKIADCIVNGKAFYISGGNYRLCDGSAQHCKETNCRRRNVTKYLEKKGEKILRVAVTYENGNVFQHFGHTQQFKVYDIEDGKITKEQIVDTNGQGHGALAGFLAAGETEVLICGGIGGGAQNALRAAGIKLYGGVQGNADAAVKAFLEGDLDYDENVHCSHHEHEEGHTCGNHGCGK